MRNRRFFGEHTYLTSTTEESEPKTVAKKCAEIKEKTKHDLLVAMLDRATPFPAKLFTIDPSRLRQHFSYCLLIRASYWKVYLHPLLVTMLDRAIPLAAELFTIDFLGFATTF